MLRFIATAISAIVLTGGGVLAGDARVGDLAITDAFAYATPPNAAAGSGYVTITNEGDTADRLIGVSADFAAAMIHESVAGTDGVMRMQHMHDGIEIASGTTVSLAPGGQHLMFMKLDGPFAEGEQRTVTLEFQNAGAVEVTLDIVKR